MSELRTGIWVANLMSLKLSAYCRPINHKHASASGHFPGTPVIFQARSGLETACFVIKGSVRLWIHPGKKEMLYLHCELNPALKTDTALKLHCTQGVMGSSCLSTEKSLMLEWSYRRCMRGMSITWWSRSSAHREHLGLTLVDLQCCDALADGCLPLFPFIAFF